MPSSDRPPAPSTKGAGQEEKQAPDTQDAPPPAQTGDAEFEEVTM
ncbi:MAG: hypothetical protein AAB345_01670 [Patescibacteria group bacterium]